MGEPAFGHTRSTGQPVHARTADHLPSHNWFARLNRRAAVAITTVVGTMGCAYAFALVALLSMPAAIRSHNMTIIIAWLSSNFIQLVLLPVIIVGQNVQAQASDARAVKTLEDTERALDLLDVTTAGGLQVLMAVLCSIEARLPDARGE